MANRFQKYVDAGGDGAPTKANGNRFAQYQPPPKPEEPGWLEKTGNFALDTLRNFNDTASFGLYGKALEATGIDPLADEKLAYADEHDPYAGVLGDALGYVLPGLGASAAVGKAVPALAGNTWKALVGREMLASGGVSATDDAIRTGTIDPMGVAIDAGAGGLFSAGFAGAGRLISPEARIRASGNDLTDPDRVMAEYYARSGEDLGVPLTVPEAVTAAAPDKAPRVQGLFDDALQTPKGSQAVQSFEAGRGPKIEQAGRDMVTKVGPGANVADVTAASDAAIGRARDMVNNSARPYYDAAEQRKLPPSWVPKSDPAYPEALQNVQRNSTLMRELTAQWKAGGNTGEIPANSLLFQDAVKKELDALASQAFDGSKPNAQMGGIFGRGAEAVTNKLDMIAPEYPVARDIADQGGAMVRGLEEGPLGRVAKQPTAKGQASTIFGVDNEVDAAASRRALAFMGAEDTAVPQGILANHLDSAVSSNPSNWANAALPTPQAKGLATDLIDDPALLARLEAAQRVEPYSGQALPGHDGSPIAKLFAGITNIGKGGVAKGLLDPDVIKKLGKTGPVQRTATQFGSGAFQTSRKRRKKMDR